MAVRNIACFIILVHIMAYKISGQSEILIAILNPLNEFHEKKAELLKQDIELQYKKDERVRRLIGS